MFLTPLDTATPSLSQYGAKLSGLMTLGSTKTISVLKLTGLGFWEKILIFAFGGLGSMKRSWALEDSFQYGISHYKCQVPWQSVRLRCGYFLHSFWVGTETYMSNFGVDCIVFPHVLCKVPNMK
ncbi:hypothetical protein ACOSQ2_003298 [Xanthoceras sorbifolium]